MKFLIIAVLTLVVACSSLEFDGQCQPVEVVQDFDIPRYTGLWYEIYRYENEFQPAGECVTASYTLNEWGNVTVLNSMVVNNVLSTIEGTVAPAEDADGEARLIVVFPAGPAGSVASNYWVLSTDYDNYALVYTCTDLPDNRKRVFSWVLSRVNYLKPQSVLDINPALQAADSLDWSLFRYTNQSESICEVRNSY